MVDYRLKWTNNSTLFHYFTDFVVRILLKWPWLELEVSEGDCLKSIWTKPVLAKSTLFLIDHLCLGLASKFVILSKKLEQKNISLKKKAKDKTFQVRIRLIKIFVFNTLLKLFWTLSWTQYWMLSITMPWTLSWTLYRTLSHYCLLVWRLKRGKF